MRSYKLLRPACVILAASFVPPAAADVIQWLSADASPIYISEGPLAGQGMADLQVRFLSDHLTGHQFQNMRVDPARAWYQMEHSDGFCFHGAPRTRLNESAAVFSRRPILVPNYRLIVHGALKGTLNPVMTAEGEVDLAKLAQEVGLVGGYIGGRTYFGNLQTFVTATDLRIRLERVPQAAQLFNLFQAGRLDFVLATALEARFYMQNAPQSADLALPIKGIPQRIATFTACSNGPRGSKVIDEIDKLESNEADWAAFMAPLRRWMEPADFAAALAGPDQAPTPD